MCGENQISTSILVHNHGTPPRVWGKRKPGWMRLLTARYTPTCVGKTRTRRPGWRLSAVHPHVCGENRLTTAAVYFSVGTPPRVWGKRPARPARSQAPNRYTPTCVGKTYFGIDECRHTLVHPHVCGENGSAPFNWSQYAGTPPRVWGKRWHNLRPADLHQVHPHVCGENTAWMRYNLTITGTPPRVWGKHRI